MGDEKGNRLMRSKNCSRRSKLLAADDWLHWCLPAKSIQGPLQLASSEHSTQKHVTRVVLSIREEGLSNPEKPGLRAGEDLLSPACCEGAQDLVLRIQEWKYSACAKDSSPSIVNISSSPLQLVR